MLTIKFNNIDTTLKFGVRFVDELNRVLGISEQNINMGMGVVRAIPGLQINDPAVLSRVLYAASYDNSPRPSLNDWFEYFDNGGDVAKLSKAVLSEIAKSNSLKAIAGALKQGKKISR